MTDYGGIGNGLTDNTAAFTRAVAAVAAAGGGTLRVPAGRFLTSPFNLTSNFTLLLQQNATLLGGVDFARWPLVPPLPNYPGDGPRYAPLLGGTGLTSVRVLGEGGGPLPILDGQGLVWSAASALKLLKGQRPHALELVFSAGLEVAGLAVLQAPFWSLHFALSSAIHVHDLSIINANGNGDGCDFSGSRDALVERVDISTADDAVTIKSGTAPPGLFPPSSNITVRDSALSSAEACVAVGSEVTGGAVGVLVERVTCAVAGHGLLYIKQRPQAGGEVRDVSVRNCTLVGPAIGRVLWLSQHFGTGGEKAGAAGAGGASLQTVMRNVSVEGVGVAEGTVVGLGAVVEGGGPPGGSAVGQGSMTGVALRGVSMGAPLVPWTCANVSGTWADVHPTPCKELTPL